MDMARIGSGILIMTIASALMHAGEPPPLLTSQYQIKTHLFGSLSMDTPTTMDGLTVTLQEPARKKKSVGLAAIYSLFLPGMGELYAENFSSGKYFLIGEGALWITYAAFDIYGNALRDDARAFAISHAGIDPRGKNDQFYVDIGNFLDIHEYNDKKLRDREPDRLYNPNAGYAWRWDSDASRATYKDQRLAGETALNNRKFVVAAVLINHLASAINAARAAVAYNNALDELAGSLQFRAEVMGGISNPHGIMLTVAKGI